MGEQPLSFGSFQLFASQRLLLEQGKPMRLGSRAFDILLALVARPGEVINKEELIAQVWPDTFVEETSLRVHIAALRKALGDDTSASRFIANVPGRGYCFVASVSSGPPTQPPILPTAELAALPSLPVSITRVIGRDDVVAAISAQLTLSRLVTILGPGGIGKTTVALAVAESVAERYRDGIAFVDLAPVTDPRAVPSALAAALGLTDRSEVLLRDLIGHLRGREMLVVFDNCEHLIAEAAGLIETLLRQVPDTRWLATSREQLRITGEWVQRLSALDVPPEQEDMSADQARRYSAVELFIERASAGLGGYNLSDADAPLVAEICRRLDGIALAIELAAGQLDIMGVRDIAASLEDCFRILTRGRRTALPRHQTLRATLDWSYRVLPHEEQVVLRRLAVFNGGFTLEAARTILADEKLSPAAVIEAVANLIAKSLISADIAGDNGRYRLMDTTRTYALEQLNEAGETAVHRHRHATYYRSVFERSEGEWETRPTPEWLEDYARHIGNLRAALDWSFGPEGDPMVGVALTVAAVPFWLSLLLVEECEGRVQQALLVLNIQPAGAADHAKMRLHAALGWPKMRAITGLLSRGDAWRVTLDLAESLGDVDYQMRALWALWVDRTNAAEPRTALELADRFCALAARSGDPSDRHIGERMQSRSLLFLGKLPQARQLIDRMIAQYRAPINRSHHVRFLYDQKVVARITLARVLWLQGHFEQAMAEVESNLAEAQAGGHSLSAAHALSDAACAVALLQGDLETAARYITMLKDQTRAQSMDVWNVYADGFQGELLIRQGQVDAGIILLQDAIQQLQNTCFILFQSCFQGAYAEGQALAGNGALALGIVEAEIARCRQTEELWFMPELHRIHAGLLRQTSASLDTVEAAYQASLQLAREQGALAWELRTAISYTGFLEDIGRAAEGGDLLIDICGRMPAGQPSPDMVTARALLDQLRHEKPVEA
ncbi:ATP-binding protein [Lacibacterium aquatile]|uniref:ATP-binding protein n=1 Tax=Lacibacterium aquatile TaxID=1168082 RepID=A0ABW5DW37_9PROT